MREIQITLPYPLSANRYWRTYMPKGFKAPVTTVSPEAKAYKTQIEWLCKAAGIREPIIGRVHVDIKLYPKRPQDYAKRMRQDPGGWDDTVQCLDLDNVNKVLFDALKGIAIEDDRWVRRLTSERMEPDGEARVIIRISKINSSESSLDFQQ